MDCTRKSYCVFAYSCPIFTTRFNVVRRESSMVAMNNWKMKCVGLQKTRVCKRTVHTNVLREGCAIIPSKMKTMHRWEPFLSRSWPPRLVSPLVHLLFLHDKAFLQRSLENDFHPFIRGLSASVPRKLYVSLFTKPRCRYQPYRANSKISNTDGNWHGSPLIRREAAASGSSFLAAATTSGWPHYRLQDIQGRLGYWSELVFPSSRSTQPKRAPLQGTPRCEPPLKERVGIFGEGCEILE